MKLCKSGILATNSGEYSRRTFDESALHDALDWLAAKQSKVELGLYREHKFKNVPAVGVGVAPLRRSLFDVGRSGFGQGQK